MLPGWGGWSDEYAETHSALYFAGISLTGDLSEGSGKRIPDTQIDGDRYFAAFGEEWFYPQGA